MQPMNVVLATDGSTGALAAADWINQHFEPKGARIEVVTVIHVEMPLYADPSLGDSYAEMMDDARRRALQKAEASLDVTEAHLARFAITRQIINGLPVEGLVRHLRDHRPDLLVMGRRGHSRLQSMVLGSVSLSMVQRSPVSVLIVEPNEV